MGFRKEGEDFLLNGYTQNLHSPVVQVSGSSCAFDRISQKNTPPLSKSGASSEGCTAQLSRRRTVHEKRCAHPGCRMDVYFGCVAPLKSLQCLSFATGRYENLAEKTKSSAIRPSRTADEYSSGCPLRFQTARRTPSTDL